MEEGKLVEHVERWSDHERCLFINKHHRYTYITFVLREEFKLYAKNECVASSSAEQSA